MGVKVREKPKGSGTWWVFIYHQGKRKAKKIGKDEDLAREVAKRIEAKLVLGDLGFVNERPFCPIFKETMPTCDLNLPRPPSLNFPVRSVELNNFDKLP